MLSMDDSNLNWQKVLLISTKLAKGNLSCQVKLVVRKAVRPNRTPLPRALQRTLVQMAVCSFRVIGLWLPRDRTAYQIAEL